MKFGIIVCPKCKKAKGVDLCNKTSKCFRCNKVIELKKIRILYRTNSQQKLRHSLGLINSELNGYHKGIKRLQKNKI
jgi:hypothetical protein